MKLTYDNISDVLRQRVPGFDAVYDEHVHDNDEVLPHVLFGDLVRFLETRVKADGPTSDTMRIVLGLVEEGLASDDERLVNLMVVSFAENLDLSANGFRSVTPLFGPRLRRVLRMP